jgi:membrane-bound ClpP family serine protease
MAKEAASMTSEELLLFAGQLSPVLMFCLVLLGLGLLVLEFYVVSFGLLAAAGLACIVLGLALLLQSGFGPGGPLGAQEALGRSVQYVLAAVAVTTVGVLAVLAVRAQLEARRRYGARGSRSSPESGLLPEESHVGDVTTAIPPMGEGKIFFRGTLWSAKIHHGSEPAAGAPSQLATLEPGARVDIVGWEGLVALVKRRTTT